MTPGVEVKPGAVAGGIRAPASKSVTQRALLLAAQAEAPCTLQNALLADDTHAMMATLLALGARIHLDTDSEEATLRFLPADLRPPRQALDLGGSATALRLLVATCARLAVPVTLGGNASLRTRPQGPLMAALHALGGRVASAAGCAPLTVQGPLRPGSVALPSGTSSQVASALALSLPFLPGDSTLRLGLPVASFPYLHLTLQCARRFGIELPVEETPRDLGVRVKGGQRPLGTRLAVEGDWSAAAFPLAAAAVSGGRVRVSGLDPQSLQGDCRVVELLAAFGARTKMTLDGAEAEGGALTSPGPLDVSETPDLFPVLAVVAAASRGTTAFTGAAALRGKESDRIAAMAEGLRRMGIETKERPDGLVVTGGALRGAEVASHGDHRVHMAFVVAGLAARGATRVEDPGCVTKSYPSFHRDLEALGAPLAQLHGRRIAEVKA